MPSDANRMNLAYVQETTFGDIEPANPTIQDLRYVSESLVQETDSVESAEIRSDRQITGVIRTGISGSGDITTELSYSAFDDFFEAGLLSAVWTTERTVAVATTDVSITAPNSIDSVAAWSNTPLAGTWIEVRGFTGSPLTNNGYFRVISATANQILVAQQTLVSDAAGETVTIDELGHIVNGTTFRSYNIEKEYTDTAATFALLTGMAIDGMSLTIAADAVTTGGFTFVGKRSLSGRTATVGDGSNTAAPANEIMNGIDNVPDVQEALVQYDITGFTMELANNLRARLQVGTLGAISLGTGTVNITGTHTAYFETLTVMDKYLDNTVSDIVVVVEDDAGNGYILDLPQIKYTSGARVAGGINTDIIADMGYTAFRDPTLGYTIKIARFTA